jgi:hypothetical protein
MESFSASVHSAQSSLSVVALFYENWYTFNGYSFWLLVLPTEETFIHILAITSIKTCKYKWYLL